MIRDKGEFFYTTIFKAIAGTQYSQNPTNTFCCLLTRYLKLLVEIVAA